MPSEITCYNLVHIKENLSEYARNGENHEYNTRNHNDIQAPCQRLESTKINNFGIAVFNYLPQDWKLLANRQFKAKLRKYLLPIAWILGLCFSILDSYILFV